MFDPLSPIHLEAALARLRQGFEALPAFEPSVDRAGIDQVLGEVATRLADNFPYPHPLYAGQMLKPPHPVALLAYSLALHLNPNNHAIDGGRASSRMEKEAVAQLARMVGWETHLGHLTGGGTMANLEALWVAGRLQPGKRIVASAQAHYTHSRISEVLGLPFASVASDHHGRMDLTALALELERGDVGTVVATMGTTALGAVDPLPDLLDLQTRHRFRIHADAAYGGYFSLATNLGSEATAAFAALSGVDSIVIDPHKHGLQPYGCGSVLFRDPAAVALWATQRLLPLEPGGAFGRALAGSHHAAERLHELLAADPRFAALMPPELDIVCWGIRAPLATAASGLARALFEEAARRELHLALVTLPRALVAPWWPDLEWDQETVTCLRSCLMKPEHAEWLDRIWARLDAGANSVLSPPPPHASVPT
jgi:glutamate/tyrosine decarboxylase-like PLP-dependent enzyme